MPLTTACRTGTLLALLAFAAAVRAGPPKPGRLIVHPDAVELAGAHDRHRVLVTAAAADGSLADVTADAQFQSQDPAVVEAREGELRPRGDGTTRVIVAYAGLTASLPVTVKDAQKVGLPSFVNDVTPLFTRLGCNQGACHGKNSGQNGFRLSLRGYAPEWDHAWLTREFTARRVNPAVPEASLLVQKPLGLVPHEGGKLLGAGSREHELLLRWLHAGAPGPRQGEPALRRLEVLPGSRTLRVGQGQQLLVRAEYSDGTRRDVTWLARFDSNDPGAVSVDPAGRLRVLRPGETAVRVSFQADVAVVIITVPFDRAVPPERYAQRHNVIDEHIFRKLQALRIEPSEECDDPTFIRRAFLDTIGTLPTPAEVRAFLADPRPDKRARLIDELLERPEFVDYWALQLGDLFQNRRERDHDVRGTKGVRAFHEWLRKQVAANRPWDALARDVLTATGRTTENPAVGYFIVTVGEHREPHRSEVTASVAQAFLGTRVGCAECHNHPLERCTQDDYYHFAGFFSRVKLERKDPQQGPTTLVVSTPNPNDNPNPVGVVQPRTGQFLSPRPLDRTPITVAPGEDPRVKLAAWMTDPSNEMFAGAMVNRLWKHFFGVGLVEPVDDLRASNPPSNPELWRALIHEFVTHRYDLKHMMRLMLNSRAYQLSAATRPGNEQDTRFYSRYYVRRLPAEVLLDAITQATGVPEPFPGYPVGVRAIQLPEPGPRSYFLALFGRSERVTACACERSGEVTMPQLLHLQNGETIMQKMRAPDGRLARLLQAEKDDGKVIEELYLATLARPPSERERAVVLGMLASGDSRDEVFRDLLWALLNAKEFAFNH
jgi:hypothetical protein